jgi:hypothetical protein
MKGHKHRCREWAKDCISKFQLINKQEKKTELIDTLEKACEGDKKKIVDIKALFIKDGLCNPDSFVLKDRKSGHKTVLASYLKSLHTMGYTSELNDIDIQKIALNSFGVKIGISTIQHARAI